MTTETSVPMFAAAGTDWRSFMRGPDGLDAGHPTDAVSVASPSLVHLARAFTFAKHGKTGEARMELEAARAALAAEGGGSDHQRADLILVDAHVRSYEDRPITDGDATRLNWALEVCDRHDFIGQGLALNQLCILSMHSGNLDKAQEYGEGAIRLYRQGGAEFGSLHLLAHLGQIKLMRGDLEGAAAQYSEMEVSLSNDLGDTGSLLAVCHALRSEVAYEMNDLAASRALLENAIQSVEEHDAWLDVRAAAYRVRIRLAYDSAGLPGAMTELSHCERIAKERAMPRLLQLMKIERLRALTLSNETEAALEVMRSIGLNPNNFAWEKQQDWAFRRGSTVVSIARWMVRARRAPDALRFLEHAEDFAIRGGQLLSLAKLRVIKASAHWRLNQKTDATGALLSSVRLLGGQPFRRFIVDEGPEVMSIVQAILDGDHLSAPISASQRKRFAELSHFSMLQGSDRVTVSAGLSGNTAARRDNATRYLELLALGMSNKDIGRTMGVSINTVKYHLKSIFRELRVENRTQAVVEVRRLGTTSGNHPNG
jgi:LuxR family maltose regulon positive regulatory protein